MKVIERKLLDKRLNLDKTKKLSTKEEQKVRDELKGIYQTVKDRIKDYYQTSHFRRLTKEYTDNIYLKDSFPFIEFAFSPLNFDNFVSSIIGEWKENKSRYEIKKPGITQRAIFFNNINDFYTYCQDKIPFAIYVGGIYSDTDKKYLQKYTGSKRVPLYRPIVFDFDDKKDWRNTIVWTLIVCYYLSRVFDITKYIMFFSGQNGIHLYPTTKTRLLMLCERNGIIREHFTESISDIKYYFYTIPDQFLIAKNILKMKNQLKSQIKYGDYSKGVDYEIYISDQELQEIIENPINMIENTENISKELNRYTPKFDTVVTKDLSRIIRLPGSMHPITFETCDPFYINDEKQFIIETRY